MTTQLFDSRVCIIRQAPYPQDLLVRREAETLHGAGFDVTVLCLRRPTAPAQELVDGVQVCRLSVSDKKGSVALYFHNYLRFFLLAALTVTWLHLRQRFAVIQVNTMPDFLVFCTLIPRLFGAKVTLVMYEPMPELWETLYHHRWMVRLMAIIQQAAIRYAHAVFAVTEQQKQSFVARGAAPDKIAVILNAPEPHIWNGLRPAVDAAASTPRPHFTLICHGALEERYGHDTMLQAIDQVKAQIPNVRLRILGRGSYQAALVAQIQALGLEPWVQCLGWVSMQQMVAELSQADVGIVAQKSSLYSNLVHTGKMYDYLEFGLPVIASRLDAVASYFDETNLRFFTPADPASLAEAILDLYQHPEKRQAFIENSQWLYEHYRWEQQKQAYVAVYQNLLKDRRWPMGNPLAVALRGKGPFTLARRVVSILRQYGITTRPMERELQALAETLQEFQCQGTFTTVAMVLARHPRLFREYQARGLEFAVHGYRHVDHHQLAYATQVAMLAQAMQVFEAAGVAARGFRGPYLHANADTLDALRAHALAYDSSQGLAWDVLDRPEPPAYRHVLDFYGALPAASYPALPALEDGLVRIPYSLPDDEALANRLGLQTPEQMEALWLTILRRTYALGEIFTVGLHPERARFCRAPLVAVLRAARELQPAVWIARLDEIAAWWKARCATPVTLTADTAAGVYTVAVANRPEVVLLARGVTVEAPTTHWANGYVQIADSSVRVRAVCRPWIGMAPDVSPTLADFLRQQGYLAETGTTAADFAFYCDQPTFVAEQQRPLLAWLERETSPLVRLGRWPNGARSALAVTGDIDCLTLWDYLARFWER